MKAAQIVQPKNVTVEAEITKVSIRQTEMDESEESEPSLVHTRLRLEK